MNCRKCLKKADGELRSMGPLCKNCFSELIEKRVRKYIRIHDFFKKNDKVAVCGQLSIFFIKKILKNLPLHIIEIKSKNDIKKYSEDYKIVRDWTADDEINFFLEQMFTNKRKKKDNSITVLRLITDEEAALYAKLHDLTFTPNKKHPAIKEFVDNIDKEYPELKFGLSKTALQFEKYL